MTHAPNPHVARPLVLPATTTPFTSTGALDIDAAGELLRAVAASGVDGMFVAGTTGEFPTLSPDEREALIAAALENAGDVEVYPHVGAASEWEAVRLTRFAVEHGATRVAAVTPYYFVSDNDALERYYRAIAEAAEGREVYAYSIPSVAHNRIDPDLVKRLENVPNLAGVKVSIAGADAIRELVEASGRLRVLAGDDRGALGGWSAGSAGIVTGPGSAVPQPYVALADALAQDDLHLARRAQGLIDDLVDATNSGSIPLIKLALEIQGLPGGPTRAALAQPSAEDRRRLEAVIATIREELGSAVAR
jgi:4-hydroxy-tetrahydrodipicolinate synthase